MSIMKMEVIFVPRHKACAQKEACARPPFQLKREAILFESVYSTT